MTPPRRALGFLTAAAAAATLFGARDVQAIPRFAVRMGATCVTCHVNPSGGGMRNRYGRNVFASTRLPVRWPDGATPAPLADVDLTDNLAVGTDLRGAYLYSRPEAPLVRINSFYLMQADLYLSATAGDRVTFYLDTGFYASGEAWALLRLPHDLYLKAGRFMPSYGLRLENHTAFTRETIGFGPRAKDTGVELGWQHGRWHLQASVLNGATKGDPPMFDDNWQKALVGRAEWIRHGERLNLMAGASGWYNVQGAATAAGDTRTGDVRAGGFVGGALGRLTYLAEADVTMQRAFSEYKWHRAYVSYQELDLLVARGVELNLGYEYLDPDLRYGKNSEHRLSGGFEAFLAPNLELKAFYRRSFAYPGDPLRGLQEVFAMLHVYL